eukprot:1156212-Pelagomonas_calceolata.AAC.11
MHCSSPASNPASRVHLKATGRSFYRPPNVVRSHRRPHSLTFSRSARFSGCRPTPCNPCNPFTHKQVVSGELGIPVSQRGSLRPGELGPLWVRPGWAHWAAFHQAGMGPIHENQAPLSSNSSKLATVIVSGDLEGTGGLTGPLNNLGLRSPKGGPHGWSLSGDVGGEKWGPPHGLLGNCALNWEPFKPSIMKVCKTQNLEFPVWAHLRREHKKHLFWGR